VDLYQTRSDTPVDKIEIQVRNGTDRAVTVDRAELRSSRLTGTATWDEPVEIPAGAAVDLKVQLPDPVCDGPAEDQVLLQVDGRQLSVAAADAMGQLTEYVDRRCFQLAVDATASLEVLRVTSSGLRIRVEPGSAKVGEVGTTPLFRPVDPRVLALQPGRRAQVRDLELEPNRCDAHALGEDKQGTYFPVRVRIVDGSTGLYPLRIDPVQRALLHRLYARMCGLS
jgi:hypothetical protein